jgi:hypothetical protein
MECGGISPAVDTCKACRRRGKYLLTECPRNIIPAETSNVLRMFDHARAHDWPLDGGMLSQSDSFLQAYELLDALIPSREQDLADSLNALRIVLTR